MCLGLPKRKVFSRMKKEKKQEKKNPSKKQQKLKVNKLKYKLWWDKNRRRLCITGVPAKTLIG